MNNNNNNVDANKKVLRVFLYLIIFFFGFCFGAASAGVSEESTNTTQQSPAPTAQQPVPEPKKEPINIDLSGNSNSVTDKFVLRKGLATVKLNYTGDSNFIVALIDSNGNQVERLVNEIGAFNGSSAVQVPVDGEYMLDLDHAMGPWTVNISQN